ncbi:uncharacterized protein [Haliotis cracherodii]|uniref:uncharacterized protein n=1 Tax=Haliotis cracherodii TaxID=6455 RepID=UPI0039E80D53
MTFSLIFLVFGCFGALFSEAQQVVPDQALLAVYGDPYGTPYYGPGASSQCTSGTCANGNCKWGYTGYVCECDVGYQNLYGNQSVCVDDSSTPFTNTYAFRNFLTSIGYTNPDMYLAPTPAKPQQHPQPPEIYAPQSPGFHAPQPPEIYAPQSPEIYAPQPPEIHYNPQPTPIHYGSQQNPSQYNPRSNPSEYNPQQNPSQRNPQPSTTTPMPVDADPTDAPPIEAQEPTPVNQRIDQNLQMMWEDPYGPQRPVFLDRSPVPPNVPRSLPPPSNQAPNPQSPPLPESNAPMAFPNQVPSFTNQITDFPTSQNQQSWIEALGPQRPAFLDQPLTQPPHQVNDPTGQFYQQGPPMRGDQGLVPTDAMGYPVSVPTQEHVLWNSDPQQQFPVNYGPNPNTGEVLVAPPNPIPGAEQVPNMPLSPEYTQPPNNSPYFYSYPTLDINTGTPPSKIQMNPQSVPMASSDVPIVSQSMSQYQVPFSQANPYMPPNPYQNPESNFGPEYNQWQHPYPSYPTICHYPYHNNNNNNNIYPFHNNTCHYPFHHHNNYNIYP